MMREIEQSIWEYFAVKRRQLYLAGLFVGVVAAFFTGMRHIEDGFPLWLLPVGGAVGVSAVWLLSLAERLQARIRQARAEGNPTGAQQVLFVIFGLLALLGVALLVAEVCARYL